MSSLLGPKSLHFAQGWTAETCLGVGCISGRCQKCLPWLCRAALQSSACAPGRLVFGGSKKAMSGRSQREELQTLPSKGQVQNSCRNPESWPGFFFRCQLLPFGLKAVSCFLPVARCFRGGLHIPHPDRQLEFPVSVANSRCARPQSNSIETDPDEPAPFSSAPRRRGAYSSWISSSRFWHHARALMATVSGALCRQTVNASQIQPRQLEPI